MSTGGMPAPQPVMPTADVGGALLPDVAPGGWKAWVSRPENRAALVQAGIQMLQPLGIGETPLSRAGTSIGAGMQARDRVIAGQDERAQQATADRLAQQEADARTTAANASMIAANKSTTAGGLTPYQLLMQDNRNRSGFLKFAQKRAADSALDATPIDLTNQADVDRLAQEYMTVISATPGAGPTLATALPGAAAGPPPHHVEYLKAHANDPKVVADFEAKYPGQSAAILTPAM